MEVGSREGCVRYLGTILESGEKPEAFLMEQFSLKLLTEN